MLLFSAPYHIYLRLLDQELAVLGLTDFAQQHLGFVTAVELPRIGARLVRGEEFGTLEARKVVISLIAPVSGQVVRVNERIRREPWFINVDPYGDGWLLEIHLEDRSELSHLVDEQTYQALASWEPATYRLQQPTLGLAALRWLRPVRPQVKAPTSFQ